MRGYITFVLAIAAMVLLLHLSALPMERYDPMPSLAVEKAYQTQQNMKELVLESARQGGQQGLDEYMVEWLATGGAPDLARAQERMREGAFWRLRELESLSVSDESTGAPVKMMIWCGAIGTRDRQQKLEQLQEGATCGDCHPPSQCLGFIRASVQIGGQGLEGKIGLAPGYDWGNQGWGVSVRQNGVSAVGYIPAQEEVEVFHAWPA